MNALVVGGTGPTGPFIVNGLLQRGYAVSILHRGTHEIPEIPPQVEHIHADPHFRETLDEALAGRTFDLVVATYGRIRFVAEALVGKTPRFIGIGGVACYRGYMDPYVNFPVGLKVPTPESAPLVASEDELRFAYLIAKTEEVVMQTHPTAAFFRYPYVYGPYQLVPREWCVMRRILDRRPYIILPDGGLTLFTHGYAANLAHAVLLAVDQPEASAGQIYNCGDETQLTLHQLVELITQEMNHRWEIICLPDAVAHPARALVMQETSHHKVMDLTKIKNDLGYKDVVPVEEAVARTVRWYVEHQPERGGEVERRLQDPFDYAAEDELVAVFKDSLRRLAAVPFNREKGRPHPYAHPKVPGQLRDHRDR
ncbi:MAG: epimerase [Thermodesulfobacteriota bacterium]